MTNKSALGTVSEYMNKKDNSTEEEPVLHELEEDKSGSSVRDRMFKELMEKYSPRLNGSEEDNKERIEDMVYMINCILDIYIPSNTSEEVNPMDNYHITKDIIPNNITGDMDGLEDIKDDLRFMDSDTRFYLSHLYAWGIASVPSENLVVISNELQTQAMNSYYEFITSSKDLYPNKYNLYEMVKYEENINRPMFMYQASMINGELFKLPEVYKLLTSNCVFAYNEDYHKDVFPMVYLYTSRKNVSRMTYFDLMKISLESNVYGDDYIRASSDNGTPTVYIGFYTWLKYLRENINMMNRVLNHTKFLEQFTYKGSVHMMKTFIRAFEEAFT